MTTKILILLLLFISTPSFAYIGDNKDFWIISQEEYNHRISRGKDVTVRRYIIVPAIDKKYKDIFETSDEKALLAKFSFLLKKNKYTWIDKYIKNYDNSLEINNLIKGLYHFSKSQYSQAIAQFEKVDNEEFEFFKLLMIADCKYEMLPEKKNYKSIIGEYQIAIDSTNNERNKSIINNRIKYIKYRQI